MTRTGKTLEARSKLALAKEIIGLCNVLGFKCRPVNKLMKLKHGKLVKKVCSLLTKFNENLGDDLMGDYYGRNE